MLTGYNGTAYLKCSLSHTKRKSAVGQKYFLIVSPTLCFVLLTRWIHSAFLEKTWIYSEAYLEENFSPLQITQTPWMLTKESLPTIILPLYFLLFLILLFFYVFLICFCISSNTTFPLFLAAFQFWMLFSSVAAFRSQNMSPFPVRYFPNADFSHSRNIIPVIVISTHLTPKLFRVILCTLSTQFLLFSLSHFHFLVTFPGSDPVVQPLVGKHKTGASGDWTIIFLCSVLLWLWAGGVPLTTARTQTHWTGTALKPFKGHRSCRERNWKSETEPHGYQWNISELLTV